MNTRIPLAIALLLAAVSSAFAKDDITKELITSNGKTRPYYLYVPSTVKGPAPLIVMLHGSNRTGVTLVEKWKDYAKKENIIIAGPDASNLRGWGSPHDGPDYLHDLVEELKSKYPINPRRVYLFGHSAGASFSLHMGLMESQYFAAVAIHAGGLRDEDMGVIELAKRKIPISMQIGDSDPLVPLKIVRATRDALKDAGFTTVELIEIARSEEHTSELQSQSNLVCRLLLEKKKKKIKKRT